MVRGGVPPLEAKRKTTEQVLMLFMEKEKLEWPELRRAAKKAGIPDSTLKRTVIRLTRDGQLKAELSKRDFHTPVYILNVLIPPLLFLEDVIDFLKERFETWYGGRDPKWADFTNTSLFSDLPWDELKTHIMPEDEDALIDAKMALYSIRDRLVLSRFQKEKRKAILGYEGRARELCAKFLDLDYRNLKKWVEKGWMTEERAKRWKKYLGKTRESELTLDSLPILEHGVEYWYNLRESLRETTKANLARIVGGISPELAADGFWLPDRLEFTPEELAEVEALERWLKDNRTTYEEYRHAISKAPDRILFMAGAGFRGYYEKFYRRVWEMSLKEAVPLIMETLDIDPVLFKAKLLENIEWFLKNSKTPATYGCRRCVAPISSVYETKDELEEHLKAKHQIEGGEMEKWIAVRDRSWYLELRRRLKSLNEEELKSIRKEMNEVTNHG